MTELRPRTVRVWDPAVRLFHWGLVLAVATSWLTGDEWETVHELAGYVVLGLVGFRLIWGFAGTRHARLGQFVRSPEVTVRYLANMVRGRERRHLGHNPAGAAMIIALILCLVATGTSGWAMTTDMFWGTEWVEETHELLANLLPGLIALHIAGVLLASFRHSENLIRAMVTGRKREPAQDDIA